MPAPTTQLGSYLHRPISSSTLWDVFYYPAEKLPIVYFKSEQKGGGRKGRAPKRFGSSRGTSARYTNVPREVYDALMSAGSHGSYFYHNIRSQYFDGYI